MRNLTGLKPYSKDNPPPGHTQKHPEGYLTCKLKKVLLKTYRCQDPETHKIKKIEGATGLMQVLVWEGMQGNVNATKEILDRIDGKLNNNSPLIDQSQHYHLTLEEKSARLNRIKEFAKEL